MNPREARALLALELAQWRQRSYAELVACIDDEPATAEIHGASGSRFGLAVQVFWYAEPGGTVRVLGSIDDGGGRSLPPLSDDFLMAPDGSFVGKDG